MPCTAQPLCARPARGPAARGLASTATVAVGTLLSGTFINGGTFCGRGKVGGDYDRLLRDEIIESRLTEQRCSVNLSCVTFCFVLLLVRPLCC